MKLFIDARYTRIGFHDGISRYTASLLFALKDLSDANDKRLPPGLELTMVISDERQLAMLPNLPYLTICAPTSALEPTAALQLNRYHPDVVFSPMQTIGLGGLGRKFKLMVTLHDLIYYSHPTPPGFLPLPVRLGWRAFHTTYAPQRFLLNKADAVATVSRTTAALMHEHKLTTKPITVVPNAPQADGFVSRQQALALAPHRSKDVLYMGSFMPYKNVETLLQAMKFLPDYRLHLLSKIAPARLAELKPLTGDNVVFHGGTSDEDYRQLLGTASALLTASRDEGYGLPVVEAQSAGCPVVLSDIPIFREIAPGASFAPADSPFAFAQAVRALEGRKLQEANIISGLEDASRYTWEQSALTLLELASSLHQP
ncbi:MAG: glycosyltransferase family 1 protein [Rothia sp. (in: high G+C Gram-positive bacteria)]|nr:glycosyltransferase family 1 protein [Rothia sp. (in: high G+C Gram-positive bacteria)]